MASFNFANLVINKYPLGILKHPNHIIYYKLFKVYQGNFIFFKKGGFVYDNEENKEMVWV